MMSMADVVFHGIPRIVFEPYMILGLLGAAGLFLARRKKYGTVFACVSAVLLFQYLWRIVFLIVSSRYAAILAMPAVLLSLAGIALIALNLPERMQKKFFALVLAVLVLTGCIKVFRPHPYSDFIPCVCRKAAEDLAENPAGKIIDLSGERWRIRYYTGREVTVLHDPDGLAWRVLYYSGKKADPSQKKRTETFSEIREGLAKYPQDTLYFFCNEKGKGGSVSAEKLGLRDSEWKMIFTQYRSGRKNSSFTVYRYKPGTKDQK